MAEQQKRQTAIKVRIKDLLTGRYVMQDGWNPNYVLTKQGKVSRANIIGVIVAKPEQEGMNRAIEVDDGTGRISARSFDEQNRLFERVFIGDTVLLIARPREYGREVYLVPEIIRKIEDKKWVQVRKLELAHDIFNEEKEELISQDAEEEIKDEPQTVEIKRTGEDIIGIIRDLDKGNGASVDDVLRVFKKSDGEQIVEGLLKQGEVFEIKPGMIKILE